MTSSFYHSLKNMALKNDSLCHVIEADVLILGSGAAGCGAAMGARSKGANVVLIDKGKLESSGCLGGGHDHFMAVLHTGPSDSTEAVVNFIKGPMTGVTEKMIEEGWVKMCRLTTEVSMERKESGRAFYLRTDYPDLNPDLNMPLIVWQENGEQKFSWGL